MLVGYARDSTSKPEKSLAMQRDALTDAGCDSQYIYADTISGANWKRPGLEDALALMRPNDTLVVTQLDKLGRGLVDTVRMIADLADQGFYVRVLDPAFDTSKTSDKVVINVMTSLAEWERGLRAQHTREGVAYARAQGRVAGPKPKLSPEQMKLVCGAVAGGESVSSVARSFGVSRQTVYRALEKAAT